MTRLYAITIFLSAFLLFLIQPLIANLSLPWFGGSASVWATCMLFFQALLLFGYLYAHYLQRLAKRIRQIIHSILLLISFIVIPIQLNPSWKPLGHEDPMFLLLGLLLTSIGLPYFLLSSTSPLLQAKYVENFPGKIPYRLFALSNVGSMLALLSYPVLIEPLLSLHIQTTIWSITYGIFIFLCAGIIWYQPSNKATASSASKLVSSFPLVQPKTKVLWFVLALCPSLLLLVITNFLTEDIAPIPFLWVLPLSLYLLSFILCFDGKGWYKRNLYIPLTLAGLTFTLSILPFPVPLWLIILFPCVTLFAACMVCHGELAHLKPDTNNLTSFYLTISLGGAMGGTLVALVAPYLFNYRYELYIGLLLMLVILAILRYIYPTQTSQLLPKKSLIFFFIIFIGVASYRLIEPIRNSLLLSRNFYGVLRVEDSKGKNPIRILHHGKINHGFQYLSEERRLWPTSYYGPNSGGGLTLMEKRQSHQRIGIVGLGAGTLATYAKPGDYYRMYEINPTIIDIAKNQFTFLRDSQAQIDLVLGDGRLSLNKEDNQNFDALIVDAFSGDAIPRHLLTQEAFALYFRHLKANGILAIHISNTHLELGPIIKLAADYYKKEALLIYSEGITGKGVNTAEWVLVSKPSVLRHLSFYAMGKPISVKTDLRMWTDDYSSLYKILKFN